MGKKKLGKHALGAPGIPTEHTPGPKSAAGQTPGNDPVTPAEPARQASDAQETAALPRAEAHGAQTQATAALPKVEDHSGDSWATEQATAVMPAAGPSAMPDGDDPLAGLDVPAKGVPRGPVPAMDPAAPAKVPTIPAKKDRRGLKAFSITFIVLACLLAAAYTGVSLMFSKQFMPNTRINGLDISMKQDDEVVELLKTIPDNYTLDVVGDTFSLRATGKDLGMTIDAPALVKAMHEDQNCWHWPWYVTETNHDETFLLTTDIDEKAADKLVSEAVKKFNKKAEPPTNASIYFDEKKQKFAIEPEKVGTQLDAKAVQTVVKAAADAMEEKVEVGEGELKQPELLSTDKKLVDTIDMANGLVSAHLTLKINGNPIDEIGTELLSGFVKINDAYEVTFSEDELAAWVDQLAWSYDTIGMERTYTRADGKTVTVSGGSYGWEVDKESLRASILDAIKSGKDTDIEIPCIDAANTYAGRGQRDWGNRYIDVDITEQHVRFYGDDGKIIWDADCITGAPDGEHDTVQGVWYVVMKQSPSKLVGYQGKKKEYETEVKYWMPFEGNSIGFHDATWQPDFGGSMYADGYGSHGCVNLSYNDAESLYDIIQPGDVVVVHS